MKHFSSLFARLVAWNAQSIPSPVMSALMWGMAFVASLAVLGQSSCRDDGSCTLDAVTALPAGTYGAEGRFSVEVETFDNPKSSSPEPVSVYLPAGATNVPVLFFSHAYGATDASAYDPLMRTLASQGIAVVHPAYASLRTTHLERYEELWAGFEAAAERYAAVFDLGRVGFVGHSFGGGATPEMARRGFTEKGWGSAGRMMFVMAPWYSWGRNYETLPVDTRTVMQIYEDDDTNDPAIAVHDIWDRLPVGIERRWLLLRSDSCGCNLHANHVVPINESQRQLERSSYQNALDVWGVARRVHALAAYALQGDAAARDVAYGVDAFMGRWVECDRDVVALEASDAPLLPAPGSYRFPYDERCENADDVPCP